MPRLKVELNKTQLFFIRLQIRSTYSNIDAINVRKTHTTNSEGVERGEWPTDTTSPQLHSKYIIELILITTQL